MVFVPRKFQAKKVAWIGGNLWGLPSKGGLEQADYNFGCRRHPHPAGGTPRAAVDLTRPGSPGPEAFERVAAGCHPVTGQRLIRTSQVIGADAVTGERVAAGGFHVRWAPRPRVRLFEEANQMYEAIGS